MRIELSRISIDKKTEDKLKIRRRKREMEIKNTKIIEKEKKRRRRGTGDLYSYLISVTNSSFVVPSFFLSLSF